MSRRLIVVLALSALIHLLVIAAPGWHINKPTDDNRVLIDAQIVRHAGQRTVIPGKRKPPKVAYREMPEPQVIAEAPPAASSEKPAESVGGDMTQDHNLDSKPETGPQAAASAASDASSAPVADDVEVIPPLPRTGRIRFSIVRGDGGFVVGRTMHEWHHDRKHYVMTATSETTGIASIFKPAKVVQTSEGGFHKGELKPETFRFDRGADDIATVRFDWQTQQATLDDGQVVAISEGAEDFLSMFYQLMQATQKGEGFVMAVATGRKVERYAFEWLADEELTLKTGRVNTWHVRVTAVSGGRDTTEVWLGKEVAGLPVKIRNTDRKGVVFDQIAEELDYEGK